jgi:hypothetical protein
LSSTTRFPWCWCSSKLYPCYFLLTNLMELNQRSKGKTWNQSATLWALDVVLFQYLQVFLRTHCESWGNPQSETMAGAQCYETRLDVFATWGTALPLCSLIFWHMNHKCHDATMNTMTLLPVFYLSITSTKLSKCAPLPPNWIISLWCWSFYIISCEVVVLDS